MALSNREKQQRYRESKIEAEESRLSLPQDDNERLQRLMSTLEHNGKKQQGYSEVFSQALKELKISLTPAPQRETVKYGLRVMYNDK